MKCDVDWLSQWVDPLPPVEELAQQLTQAGLEVDQYDDGVLDIDLTPNRGGLPQYSGIGARSLGIDESAIVGDHDVQ